MANIEVVQCVEQWSANHLNESCDICGYWNYDTWLADATGEEIYNPRSC